MKPTGSTQNKVNTKVNASDYGPHWAARVKTGNAAAGLATAVGDEAWATAEAEPKRWKLNDHCKVLHQYGPITIETSTHLSKQIILGHLRTSPRLESEHHRIFNVLFSDERIGGQDVTIAKVSDFLTCVQRCELQDISAIGGIYTWTNRQNDSNRVYSKMKILHFGPLWFGVLIFGPHKLWK